MKNEKKEFSKEQVIIDPPTPESIEAINKYQHEYPEYRQIIGMLIDIMNIVKAMATNMGIVQRPPPGKIVKPNLNVRINPKSLGEN